MTADAAHGAGRWVLGGIGYFALVFAAGFALGTIRVLVVAPRLGVVAATLAELPVMVAVSWWTAGLVVGRLGIPARSVARLGMGAVAFGLLIGAEWILGIMAFGRTAADILAQYATGHGAAGLAAQVIFALIPDIRRRFGV